MESVKTEKSGKNNEIFGEKVMKNYDQPLGSIITETVMYGGGKTWHAEKNLRKRKVRKRATHQKNPPLENQAPKRFKHMGKK